MQTGLCTIKVTAIHTHTSCFPSGRLMKMRNGRRNTGRYLPTHEMIKADRSMIRQSHHTIPKTESIHHSFAFPFLMITEIRKQGYARARVRNTCGSESTFPLMTGTNTPKQRNGESRGRNTATVILHPTGRSTTVLMKGRGLILSRPYMRA